MLRQLVVIGSSNTDMVVKTPQLPLPGETVLGGTFFMFPGGKGANQAVAAARLGGNVTFVARVGNDIFGKQAVGQFQNEGIHTEFIGTDEKNPSGVALITVDATGENSIAVAPGANAYLSTTDVDKAAHHLQNAAVVLIQLEIPLETVAYAIKRSAQWQRKVILNPAPAQPLPDEWLKYVHVITPNETEAELLTGIRVTDETTAEKAADALRQRGVQQVVLTMGAKGAYVRTDTVAERIPAPLVQPVDTTAAGDVFNGALAVALAEGMPLEKAVAFACRAAAVSVTRMGAQASAPYRTEIK